jgi:hydroxymethylpyrimidine/phosphomethylpyrimidine kinase
MRVAAARLLDLGAKAVVVKGGHLSGEEAIEFLSFKEGTSVCKREFRGPRIETRATHGTGCAFSSSLACHLAIGRKLPEAVALAKQYVATAMRRACELGSGNGPLNHLFGLSNGAD